VGGKKTRGGSFSTKGGEAGQQKRKKRKGGDRKNLKRESRDLQWEVIKAGMGEENREGKKGQKGEKGANEKRERILIKRGQTMKNKTVGEGGKTAFGTLEKGGTLFQGGAAKSTQRKKEAIKERRPSMATSLVGKGAYQGKKKDQKRMGKKGRKKGGS